MSTKTIKITNEDGSLASVEHLEEKIIGFTNRLSVLNSAFKNTKEWPKNNEGKREEK